MTKRRKNARKHATTSVQSQQQSHRHHARTATARSLAGRVNALLQLTEPIEPRWRWLPVLLALAMVPRALVALSGDFTLHPDEVMQYLEAGHRLAFGPGVLFWEYVYGGRSLLTPGLVAGVLLLAEAVGLGEPRFYIPLVKLVFCALSLLIPLGMYNFGRLYFNERTARVALLLGCFWYEFAVFAHKPMTEFTATALLFGMLALITAAPCSARRGVVLALLAVLIAAVRMQYAPLAGLILLLEFIRTDTRARQATSAAGLAGSLARQAAAAGSSGQLAKARQQPGGPGRIDRADRTDRTDRIDSTSRKGRTDGTGRIGSTDRIYRTGSTGKIDRTMALAPPWLNSPRFWMVAAGVVGVVLVGLFEKLTWGSWYHSYLLNIKLNFALDAGGRDDGAAFWHFPWRLMLASCGLAALAVITAVLQWRHCWWLLVLFGAVLLLHGTQTHQEYRFIFVAIPLWLLLFAHGITTTVPQLLAGGSWHSVSRVSLTGPTLGLGAALLVSIIAIGNWLPWLAPSYDARADGHFNHVYRAYSNETGRVGFLRDQDPQFQVYLQLAADPAVSGVLDATRYYFGTGGYYYLHRAIPYYDLTNFAEVFAPPAQVPHARYVSHIITGPVMAVQPQQDPRSGDVYLAVRPVSAATAVDAAGWNYMALPAYVYTQLAADEPPALYYWNARGQPAPAPFSRAGDYQAPGLTVWQTTDPGQVMPWRSYQPVAPGALEMARLLLGPEAPPPPANGGIEFLSPDPE